MSCTDPRNRRLKQHNTTHSNSAVSKCGRYKPAYSFSEWCVTVRLTPKSFPKVIWRNWSFSMAHLIVVVVDGCLMSQSHARVSQGRLVSHNVFYTQPSSTVISRQLRDGSIQTTALAVTSRQKLPIKLAISSCHTILARADQSKHRPHNTRRLAGLPLEYRYSSDWCD